MAVNRGDSREGVVGQHQRCGVGKAKNSETGSHRPAVLDGCPLVRFISAISSRVQESAQAHNMLVVLSALFRIV